MQMHCYMTLLENEKSAKISDGELQAYTSLDHSWERFPNA